MFHKNMRRIVFVIQVLAFAAKLAYWNAMREANEKR